MRLIRYLAAVARLADRLGWELMKYVGGTVLQPFWALLATVALVVAFVGLHFYLAVATLAFVCIGAVLLVAAPGRPKRPRISERQRGSHVRWL